MSKFDSVEKYLSTNQYELLPFKFDRLDDDYVLTNMVGEYHIVSDKTLRELVAKKIPNDSGILNILRSKHFIRYQGEQAPLELLALKTRTQKARLAEFTNLHMFVVSLRCDHSCPYCQVSRQSDDKSSFDMTEEIADKAIDFCFKSPNKAIKIEFQGGEPLLNFEIVKYVVLETKKRNEIENRDLQFVIATTLSLITDEILEFCSEHKICISSSLDGPEELHNSNRPRQDKDSYQRFVDGLKKAREALGYDQVSALMTTTEASLSQPKEIIDEYLKFGFDGIFLRALSPYGFAIKTKKFNSYNTERWLEFYFQGLEYIIELNKKGVKFTEFFAATILSKILSNNDPGFVDLMTPSGIGIAAIVFNYDGDVYASDESRMLAEMGDKTFQIGNLLSDNYEDIILSDQLLDPLESSFSSSAPMCSDCAFESYCGSDPVFHHAMFKDYLGRKPESSFCSRNMSIFKFLITKMRDDVEAAKIFRGWANLC